MTNRLEARQFLPRGWWRALVLILLCACGKGPTVPNEDIERPADGAHVAVVFVHGILGHASNTFAAEGQQPWPEWLATDPKLTAPVHVLSLAYASEPLQQASNIQEIATRLRSRLQVEQRIFERFDKVVFIAHSMGGLVVRRLLLQLSRDDPEAYGRVAGVFFMAVPAGGSDLAAGVSWISGNPQFGNMRPEDANAFLQTEADDWVLLMRHRPTTRPYPRSYCAYETQPMGPLVVVPRSRSQFVCDETPNAFERNHATLVKPSGLSDEVHRFVVARLNRLIDDADVPLSVALELLSPTNQPLPADLTMRTGDQFALRVHATRPAWIYVFGIDGTRRVKRYFPTPGGGVQPTPQSTLRVPSDKTQVMTLDKVTGVEQYIAIVTMSPDPELAKWGEQASSTPPPTDLSSAFEKRGSYFTKTKHASLPPPADHTLEISPSGAHARATLTFWHQ